MGARVDTGVAVQTQQSPNQAREVIMVDKGSDPKSASVALGAEVFDELGADAAYRRGRMIVGWPFWQEDRAALVRSDQSRIPLMLGEFN